MARPASMPPLQKAECRLTGTPFKRNALSWASLLSGVWAAKAREVYGLPCANTKGLLRSDSQGQCAGKAYQILTRVLGTMHACTIVHTALAGITMIRQSTLAPLLVSA